MAGWPARGGNCRAAPPRPGWRLGGAVCWSMALVVVLPPTGPRTVATARPTPRTLHAQQVPSVHGTQVVARPRPTRVDASRPVPVAWPVPGSATVDLTAADQRAGSGSTAGMVRAGTLPVWVGRAPSSGTEAAGTVGLPRVTVSLDAGGVGRAWWGNGLLLRLSRTDRVESAGKVRVRVDYSGFAGAFGGEYGNRLRLVALSGCAPDTPPAAGCRVTPLESTNDTSAKQVSAEVRLDGSGAVTMLALTAGASDSAGTFSATSLSPSSGWSAGDNSGDFRWRYPMRVPPSLGGPSPMVGLVYSSASVDGRNETTNNQPSWVGEGFDFWPGYIARAYKPCADDEGSGANNSVDTGDECWGTDNAVLSMSGHSGELIKDDTTGVWRLTDDDNSRIERLTDTVNTDNDHEYWKLTTADGTQFFFGLDRLPGYTGSAPANKTANSVWTVPVAGNHPGEPCHATGFTASFCPQAWRWNLDYVVDPHGNTMSLFYTTETNNYARNLTDTDVQPYVRGGWLDHIDYGTDNRSGTDTEQTSSAAPMRVQFGTDDRCLSSCTLHDVNHWPDTPWDQSCTSTTSCPGLYTPTFWVTRRLASITTRIWDTGSSGYRDVDGWTLTHTYPPSGDDTRNGMWLASIVHTGKATGPAVVAAAVSLPSVSFDWTQLPNRVDTGTDHKPPMNWMRLSTIWTDTGAKIDIRYTPQDCVAGSRIPTSPQSNTLRCYPVLEEQADKSITTEYFHKYLVASLTQADWTGGGLDVTTTYTYVGDPGWRHADDDGMTRDNLRTWSDFRGYRQVNTQVGPVGGGQQTLTESTFFQGMNGDLNGSGGTRSVSLAAVDGDGDGTTTGIADAPAVADETAYAGVVRQTTVYDGVETAPVSTTVNQPWQSTPTATRDMGQTVVYARHTAVTNTWAGEHRSAGGWRVSRVDTTLDSYGMPNQTDDRGDVALTGDERCTTTTYSRNTAANLLQLPGEIDAYALSCAQVASPGPASDADAVAMIRHLYDHLAVGGTPIKGEPTETQVANAWTSTGGPTWLTQSTATFDSYGRGSDTTDVRGNHTTIAYTPTAGAPVTSIATTTVLGTTTATVEPAWGITTAVVDVNSKRTEVTYDALGRTSQVWHPNHLKASFPNQPDVSYTYLVRNTGGTNAITVNTLNAANTYTTSIALYDGLTRPRQVQTVSLANGHVGTVFNDTGYDSQGRIRQQSQHFDATVQPSTTLYAIADWQPKTQTVTQYDRANRVTAQIFNSAGIEQWRTTTSYDADRINVTPPVGGTATTTVRDAHGRTTELRHYHDRADVGANTRSLYDAVSYHYNRKSQLDSWADNAGNTWTAGFDLLGRTTSAHDPDNGDSTATFNDAGDLLSTQDFRNMTVAYTYDTLGRKTGEYTPTTAGTKLATWTYDPLGAKGHLASASRWIGADEYKKKINGYTPLYQPTSETYTIPASQPGFVGSYTFSHSYKVDGSPATLTYPNIGGLGAETLTYTYDSTDGLPEQLQTNSPGLGQYAANTDYTAYGELSFVSLQTTAGNFVQRSYTYDDATHRLNQAVTIRQITPQAVDDTQYRYDAVGNITKIQSQSGGGTDTQCYDYDYARRLTEAWTPATGDCSQPKSAAALGGPAPFWQSWTFDTTGDRKTQTSHTAAGDTTATYTYPAPGSTRPHAVTAVATTGPGVNTTGSYSYDNIGNTTSRPGPTAAQTLTWTVEGRLAKVTENGADTSYVYDADGNRLIQTTPTATTLYLPGHDITRNNSTGTVTATRYYTWAGQTIGCTSTGGQLTWLITDHQGTQQLAITSGNQTITQRRQTPYGTPRGTNPTWPTTRAFVGGTNDPTGLTHEGAREYDPDTGRFISADPLFDASNPQSWNGYAYADNNPTTFSDPTGQWNFGAWINKWFTVPHDTAANAWAKKIRDHYTRYDSTEDSNGSVHLHKTVPHVTTDRPNNIIPGASGNNPKNAGYADIICWDCEPGKIFIWEVKNAGGKAEDDGYTDVARYVRAKSKQLGSSGKVVEAGPDLDGTATGTTPDGRIVTARASTLRTDPGVVVYTSNLPPPPPGGTGPSPQPPPDIPHAPGHRGVPTPSPNVTPEPPAPIGPGDPVIVPDWVKDVGVGALVFLLAPVIVAALIAYAVEQGVTGQA